MRIMTILILLLSVSSLASERYNNECRGNKNCNEIDIDLGGNSESNSSAESSSESSAESNSESSAESTSMSGGGSASVSFAKRAPTNFLYMQNQVEACGRTFGISGSNTSGGWAFGIPIPRSWTPTCDLWKAANEAQENGFVFTSYMFQCSIKAVRKVLGDVTCDKFERMSLVEFGMIDPPPDLTEIYDRAAKYDERWLMADVTQEDYEQQQEEVEQRLEQQDALLSERAELIKEYDKNASERDVEIERLKKAEAERAATRARIKARLAERESQDGS